MSETVIDTTISSGGQATGEAAKADADDSVLVLDVSGGGNASDLDVELTGVARNHNGSAVAAAHSQSVSSLDVSSTAKKVIFQGMDTFELAEIAVRNNGGSAADVTITRK